MAPPREGEVQGVTLATPDPFTHLPGLRHRITPPHRSQLRVTPQVLAQWDERARALGRPPDWRLSDAQIDGSCAAVLGARDATEDLWIYAYGSLMWDPGIHFAEVRLADLDGYQRRFSYRTTVGRGSPEQPGMMLTLEPAPGRCHGLALRIERQHAREECALLWRREMLRGGYVPVLLPVATPQGAVTALAFTANPAHPDHTVGLSLDETARIVARAAGVLGSNRHYLEQLAAQLDSLGIEDEYVRQLLERVISAR